MICIIKIMKVTVSQKTLLVRGVQVKLKSQVEVCERFDQ